MKWWGLTFEQGCGVVCAIILCIICYGFPSTSFPWWLRTIVAVFCLVTVAMLWNVRITFHRNKP